MTVVPEAVRVRTGRRKGLAPSSCCEAPRCLLLKAAAREVRGRGIHSGGSFGARLHLPPGLRT